MNKLGVSIFLLRMVLGISFFVHGLVKFQGGIGNTVGWFESIGIPGFLAYVVGTIELVGGIALILGLGTRIVSALLAVVMIGAILKVKIAIGFLGTAEMAGYELDLAFLVIALFLAVNGSKLWSVDGVLFYKPTNE
ncbi:DoxX family protein [Domibacillus aminovorans]|uniref:Oxidoreductase n=1 Tax=Domibacillus aminovorans TaxID=29332 RepID=A0A177L7Z2_9BACI|nr:DoxX family protein [Domibacillus aminovorans]OAH61693.1 oxidoreductase [Domibacillus aminovorans]